MKDPFFIEPVPWLSDAIRPVADLLNMPTLPLHIHEVLGATLLYSVIFWPISPIVSRLVAPQHYSKLPRKRRLNWDARVVSMVQSILINALAIWVIVVDDERRQMGWAGRIWGYTGAGGMINGLAAGYFVWDLAVTSVNIDVFGPGALAHAAAALFMYSLGFRPFLNYYASTFILWELSTPFLNVHWFMDKVNMTGTRAQLYNGILLLFTFFSCRLVVGTYQSFRVMQDLRIATYSEPSPKERASTVMAFATETTALPVWLAVSCILSNFTLSGLNFYWFILMVSAVRKRFVPAGQPSKAAITEGEVDLSTVALGASGASGASKSPAARRRKA